jgi:peptidyl-Asp metalloendopeptidase
MPRVSRLLTALILVVSTGGCAPERRDDRQLDQHTAGLLGPGVMLTPWHESVLRARTTRIDWDITLGDEAPDDGLELATELDLELFEGVTHHARLEASSRVGKARSWRGSIEAAPLGGVSFAVVEGTYAGTVRTRDGLFQVLHRAPYGHVVVELDEAAIPDEAPPEAPTGGTVSPQPVANADGGTTVDLMVVYTPDALAGAGGVKALEATIALAIEETNLGYESSGVDVQVRLVHTMATAYDEAGFSWSDTLTRLRGKGDGYMDELHAQRDVHGADHVVLLVETVGPYAGIGYQLFAGAEKFFDAWAFAVVARDYATGAYTFGHELGHNMGANHDHDNASSPGYFADSHGLQVPSHGYRTIMAYSCGGCARINHWSNPAVKVVGAASGVEGWADNARTLGVTAPITAEFRSATIEPPADIASLTSPPPGSTLPGAQVTFGWTDAGAQDYHLSLGVSPGDASYADVDAGTSTSAQLAGLPLGGETIHARLWSLTATDGWHFRDASYVAALGKAAIVSPVDGSALISTAVPIVWKGAGAMRLAVGSPEDPTRYFVADGITAPSVVVPGLPDDGGKVLVELWSAGEMGWLLDATTYHAYAAPQDAPRIQYPPAGSTLVGDSAHLRWSYHADATSHEVVVHGQGGVALAHEKTQGQHAAISGLPTDGSELTFTLRSDTGATVVETVTRFWAATE